MLGGQWGGRSGLCIPVNTASEACLTHSVLPTPSLSPFFLLSLFLLLFLPLSLRSIYHSSSFLSLFSFLFILIFLPSSFLSFSHAHSPPFLFVPIPRKILSRPGIFSCHALSLPDCRTAFLPPQHREDTTGPCELRREATIHQTGLYVLKCSSPLTS